MQTYEILLISQSPRRRQILLDAGYKFSVDTVKVSESFEKNVNPLDIVSDIARRKAEAFLKSDKYSKSLDKIMITADTLVAHAGQVLGKPRDEAQAVEYLRSMSGQTHQVLSSIFVQNLDTGERFQLVETTNVKFSSLTEKQILDYVATGEPMDKAGAYGIQGAAKEFVEEYKGSYLNVVGFPLEAFEKEIETRNWNVARATTE